MTADFRQRVGTHIMGLPAKLVRAQLNFLKPFAPNVSLEMIRRGQDKLGEIMGAMYRKDVLVREHDFPQFQSAWILPRDERRQGVILYLHGGGYTCGDLEYAKGFGAVLAAQEGVRGALPGVPSGAGTSVSRGAGGRGGGVPVPAGQGVRAGEDPPVRGERGGRAVLRPVLVSAAAGRSRCPAGSLPFPRGRI